MCGISDHWPPVAEIRHFKKKNSVAEISSSALYVSLFVAGIRDHWFTVAEISTLATNELCHRNSFLLPSARHIDNLPSAKLNQSVLGDWNMRYLQKCRI